MMRGLKPLCSTYYLLPSHLVGTHYQRWYDADFHPITRYNATQSDARFNLSMPDSPSARTALLPASIPHASEPLAPYNLMGHVDEMNWSRDVESRDPYRPNWSVTTSHKSEKDADDGSLLSPLVDGRYRDKSCSASMKRDEEEVEAQVREALRLLEDDGDGGSEEEQEHEQWTTRASAETYWEGENEVMEDKWVTDDQEEQFMTHWGSMERSVGSDEEEDEIEEEEEKKEERDERHDDDENVVQLDTETKSGKEDGRQSAQNDEWQEAYTAKGRVYYYNRCTRESFWKKYVLLETAVIRTTGSC